MNIVQALERIYSLHQFDIKLGLERVEKLLEYLGNPHKKIKSFHIAGSNGKGSTSSFLYGILREAGYNTGIYTSPHLIRFNERIRFNETEIDDDYITEFIASLDNYIKEHRPTFFEITTALAFKYFYERKADWCVIETGLGGRLDATNLLLPQASVITTISMEHSAILGDSLQKIAAEKAGIIKKGVPVYAGLIQKEAMDVIKKKAEESESKLFRLESECELKKDGIFLKSNSIYINDLPLKGKHQLYNAALASLAVSELPERLDNSVIISGLKKSAELSGIQCRYEKYHSNPDVIFDAGHNPEGVKAFVEQFAADYPDKEKNILIFGCMSDKNAEEMLKMLGSAFGKVLLTKAENNERSREPEELRNICINLGFESSICDKPAEYIKDYCKGKSGTILAVLGSIYLLGDIKEKLE